MPSAGGVFADRASKFRLLVKTGDDAGQREAVLSVAQDETIKSFRDYLRTAVADTGDHRKTAGHGFPRRQREGIVKRRAGVDIRGGVEAETGR